MSRVSRHVDTEARDAKVEFTAAGLERVEDKVGYEVDRKVLADIAVTDDAILQLFPDDERLQRLFSFQAMYAGLSPFQALAIYAVITYMDVVNGVVVPEGGMHALPTAMASTKLAATRASVMPT